MARARTEEGIEIGRRLAALRARHHLTQQAAADLLKVGYRTYQAWEAGDSVPRWRNRVKLGELYGVKPAEILGPPTPAPEEEGQLDRIELRLSTIETDLSALVRTVEHQAAARIAAAAGRARQQAPGTPRKAGRQGRA